jgi:hypothetical protein
MRTRVRFALLAIFAALGLAFSVTPASAMADIGDIYLNNSKTAELEDNKLCQSVPTSNRVDNQSATITVKVYAASDLLCQTALGTVSPGNDTTFTFTFGRYSTLL